MKLIKIILLIASVAAIGFFGYRVILQSRPFAEQPTENQTAIVSQETDNSGDFIKSAYSDSENIQTDTNVENILILGRPGEIYIGSNLTDTIIVAHLDQANKRGVLISLPRDFLVKNPNTGALTKINSLYQSGGIAATRNQVEEITGLKIDRYAIIDLIAAQEVIDLVDGLNIYVPEDIYDPNFPGPGYSYDPFILEAGWRYLDGRNVLRYVRTRYTSSNGDFDRMYRQQQVLRLVKQKILELNPLWDFPTYVKIYNTLKEHIITDLDVAEMQAFWRIAQETKAEDIATVVIDKKETDLLTSGSIPFGDVMASCIWPKAGKFDYQEIKDYIKERIK